MKKLFKKKKKGLFDYKFNIIIDERISTIKPGSQMQQKLEEANKRLANMKLPK